MTDSYSDASSPGLSVSNFQVSKNVDIGMGELSLNPEYDVKAKSGSIVVSYGKDDTSFAVDTKSKKLSLTRTFLESSSVTPTLSLDGDVSLAYTRSMDNGGKITTMWKPDDSISLKWSDGEWDTTFTARLEGYYKIHSGLRVTTRRSVNML